ncbi:CU044_5270 family protein [Streptomyces sp. NBC_00467]
MTELPERDLPPGRHRVLKEHLMSEIGNEKCAATARKVWRRPAFMGPLLAGAVAASMVIALAVSGQSSGDGDGDGADRPPTEAAALLEDIALAAEHSEQLGDIRDDQFVYIESRVGYVRYVMGEKRPHFDPVHKREVWLSVDGTRQGLLREDNDNGESPLDAQPAGIERNTSYRHLQTLPTDPDGMLKWLHRVSENGKSEDQSTFTLVGDLLGESLMPPDVSAALYRAAAKIPGVEVVEDTVDAAGRRGVGVARESDGVREELIFDKTTKAYLGERGVAVRDTVAGLRKGEVAGARAIMKRVVVDRVRQTS